MEETAPRWYPGEILFAVLFVLASVVAWWGTTFLSGDGSRLWIFFLGLVFAAVSFSVLAGVDGTHRIVRRTAVVLGTGSVVPIVFLSAPLLGGAAALAGVLFLEIGSVRIGQLRNAFRQPSIALLARRGLPFYFSSVSVAFALAVIVSPIGTRIVANPLPEKAVRFALAWADPVVRPLVGFSLQGTIDDVIGSATGITDAEELRAVREQFSSRLAMTLTGEEDLATVLAETARREFLRFQTGLDIPIRVGVLVAAFLLFRFLSLPFTWAAVLLLIPMLRAVRGMRVAVDIEEPAVRTMLRWGRR